MRAFAAAYLFAYRLFRPLGLLVSALVERWQDIRREWALRNVPHDARCWCNKCRAHRRRFMRRATCPECNGDKRVLFGNSVWPCQRCRP